MKCRESTRAKKPDDKKAILLISQEITFVQKLADNDVRVRDRAVKKLRSWLEVKTKDGAVFTKEDAMILWRGLFYCMWNSDKPLVQEDLCDNMSNLVHHCLNEKDCILFLDGFFSTFRYEWPNIDNFRMPKYEMLVRRMLRQALARVAQESWKLVGDFGKVLWDSLLKPNKVSPAPFGLVLHVCEIFLQEVAKCAIKNEVTEEALLGLLKPFARCLAHNDSDARLRGKIDGSVFGYLVEQSDVGIEQQEKIEAWKSMGCPPIDLNDIEKVEDDDEEMSGDDDEEMGGDDDEEINGDDEEEELENGDTALDPRAGQVNVELPQLEFDAQKVADMIESFYKVTGMNAATKKYVKRVAKKFRDLQQGVHPVPFEIPVKEEEAGILKWKPKNDAKRSAQELLKFEDELLKDSAKNYKKNKKRGVDVLQENGVDEEPAFKPHTETPFTKKQPKNKSVEEPPKKRRRRASLVNLGNWEVTEVSEATPTKKSPEKVASPGNVGNWDISKVGENGGAQAAEKAAANSWEEPLKEGEYEYFVAPKKSPKRRSLYKAPTDAELVAEEHSPVHDGKENEERSIHSFTFNAKSTAILEDSPKSSRTKTIPVIVEPPKKDQPEPVTPIRKARASLPLNAVTPEMGKTARIARQSLLLPALTNSAKKRVSIQLQHNKAQEVHEYVQQLRNSPHTPHDPSKKPIQGLLKSSPVPFKVAIEKFKRTHHM